LATEKSQIFVFGRILKITVWYISRLNYYYYYYYYYTTRLMAFFQSNLGKLAPEK